MSVSVVSLFIAFVKVIISNGCLLSKSFAALFNSLLFFSAASADVVSETEDAFK